MHHPSTIGSPGEVAAKTFFGDCCPKLLLLQTARGRRLRGRIAFELSGRGGGRWCLDLDGGEVLEAGGWETPDLTVCAAAPDFESFVNGRLDPALALQEERLSLQGDVRFLQALSLLFLLPLPGTSPRSEP